MKRKIAVTVLLLLIAGSVYWGFRYYSRPKPLILSGTIEARDVEIGSLMGGRIDAIHAKEGDRVKAGQVIVSLQTGLIDTQIQEQKGRVEEARANLDRVEKGPRNEELRRAKLDWENAERERDRLESLVQQGVVGRQQYEDAATRASTAGETYRELERGSRSEDVRAARAALEREEGRLAYFLRQREEATIKSPADGVIESLDFRPGELLAANQPVARILEPDQLWVRIYIPEPKLGLVRPGARVGITVDSYPGREFSGKIVEIDQEGQYTPRNIQTLNQRFDQVFGMKVEIDPSPELKPGMAALVQLFS